MAKGLGHAEFNEFRPYDFQEANRKYIKEAFKGDLVVGARSRVGIITCCDARSSPDHYFQLPENEAFIIRNGGGRTASEDVIRTIASIEILSDIKELKIIHHTGESSQARPPRPQTQAALDPLALLICMCDFRC